MLEVIPTKLLKNIIGRLDASLYPLELNYNNRYITERQESAICAAML